MWFIHRGGLEKRLPLCRNYANHLNLRQRVCESFPVLAGTGMRAEHLLEWLRKAAESHLSVPSEVNRHFTLSEIVLFFRINRRFQNVWVIESPLDAFCPPATFILKLSRAYQ